MAMIVILGGWMYYNTRGSWAECCGRLVELGLEWYKVVGDEIIIIYRPEARGIRWNITPKGWYIPRALPEGYIIPRG